ncbi:MAG: hypothetical protein OHK003_25410 [Anaerolineales bacterium]
MSYVFKLILPLPIYLSHHLICDGNVAVASTHSSGGDSIIRPLGSHFSLGVGIGFVARVV